MLLTRDRAKVLLGVILTGIGVHTLYENRNAIKQFMSVRPSVSEIVSGAQGNVGKLIADLKKHDYKKHEVRLSDLTSKHINASQAQIIISRL